MKNSTYLLLSSSVILLGFITFRVFVRKDYKEKGELSNFSTFLEFLTFAAHANLSYVFLPAKWPLLPTLPEIKPLVIFGFIVSIVGLVLTIWSMSGLGFQKAFGQEQEGLNKEGFYKFTRNPQIVAYALVIIGLAIVWPSIYAVGWVLVFFLIAHWMVLTEEEHLLRLFSDDYLSYCQIVPRYLPKLKKFFY